jgi:diguanylate cyclase (GGDEF)-like protein/putative nucleotidyltransferase with HDIG domain
MNLWAVIPLISCITYAALVILVLQQARRRVDRVFALFLAASGIWSFSAFMLTRNPDVATQNSIFQPLIFWNVMVLAAMPLVTVCYYHFVRAYNNKPGGIGIYIGYAIVPVFLGLGLGGYVVKSAYMVNGALYHDIGPWVYILMAILMPFLAISMFMLARRLRSSIDPTDRNRTMYLITGWSVNVVLGYVTPLIPALAVLPTDHIGALANALIISYAILRYQLLDIRFVVRRGLAYFLLGASLIGIYIGIVMLEFRLFPTLELPSILLSATSIAILLALAARPLRLLIQEQVDRLFHGETHIYRQALLGFSGKMGNILNLEEVANEMLPTICKALRLTQAKLLFQEMGSGDFITQITYPPMEEEANVKLRFNADNPIVTWLTKEGKPLGLEQMASIPQLKGLWAAEKEHLAASDSRLLCPIRSRGNLIGILALGKKQTNSLYSHEDINLVMSMANQAGIVVENAQLYTLATTRANTDGLTDLYNHRHFHERLEQEIARGSRFGTMFSLIMLDIDLFKTYNDIYGHLAGDQNLRKLAEHIKGSIRNIDMAFRYGGEEFTIILPETRLDDAYNVAERIRKRVETKMSSKIMPLTISLGVATWPADGVTKEEIIATADTALYRAKQTGRDRTCLSSDVVKPEAPLASTDSLAQRGALSIIYALAATVDAKDHYTYGHSKKVSEYAVALAEALGLPRDRIATIRAAALLHDIGKIGVPDSILNKQGPLTEAEWEPIKEHPQLGAEILRHVVDLVNCLPAILHHHEHFDGTGYPSGLQSDNIPLEARILAIADAYDAITSLRPYRRRLSSQEALAELKRCARTQFDPELVDIFNKLMEPAFSRELEIK